MRGKRKSRPGPLAASLAILAVAVAALLVSWVYLRNHHVKTETINAILAIIAVVDLTVALWFGQPLFAVWLDRRRSAGETVTSDPTTLARIYRELLEAVTARRAVGVAALPERARRIAGPICFRPRLRRRVAEHVR